MDELIDKLISEQIDREEFISEINKFFSTRVLGEDLNEQEIYPGDFVLRDGKYKEVIEFGKHREKFDCGYVIGWYVPDYCLKKPNKKWN